jgi:hypothetical protein
VAATQGAGDVLGAKVVLELGLREGAHQRAPLVAGREVEEGACDRGAAEAAVEGHVLPAQPAADEQPHRLDLRAISRQ